MIKFVLLVGLYLASVDLAEPSPKDQIPVDGLVKYTRTKRQTPDPLSVLTATREAGKTYAKVGILIWEKKYSEALRVYMGEFWGGYGLFANWFLGLEEEENPFYDEVRREFSGLKQSVQLILSEFDRVIEQVELKSKLQEFFSNEKDVLIFADSVEEYTNFTIARKHKFLSDCVHLDMNHRFNYFFQETTLKEEQSLIEILKKQLNLPLYTIIMLRLIAATEFAGLYYIACLKADESEKKLPKQIEANLQTAILLNTREQMMKRRIKEGLKYIQENYWDGVTIDVDRLAGKSVGKSHSEFTEFLLKELTPKYPFAFFGIAAWDELTGYDWHTLLTNSKGITKLRTYGRCYAVVPLEREFDVDADFDKCHKKTEDTIVDDYENSNEAYINDIPGKIGAAFKNCMDSFNLWVVTREGKGLTFSTNAPRNQYTIRSYSTKAKDFADHEKYKYTLLYVL